MCVCVCVCVYVCVCVCACVCVQLCVYDCVYAIMYVSECMYKIICIRVEKRILCVSGRKHLCALNISI